MNTPLLPAARHETSPGAAFPAEPSDSIPSSDPLLDAARDRFSVNYLFPYQRLVISNTLESAHEREQSDARQVVILPTGAGKSLCFQLPAALLRGCTVVVYPLLSLIADQARRLETTGIPFATLSGRTPPDERQKILRGITEGRIRILLTNPETLTAPTTIDALSRCRVDHLVVDEAHCVCEWGETFRPAYLEIGAAAERIAPRVLTAFTATASPYVLASIRRQLLHDRPAHLISANPDRPNIRYEVVPAIPGVGALHELLAAHRNGPSFLARPYVPVLRPAIIFCRSRAGTELIAGRLRRLTGDSEIRFYHAGLSNEEKSDVERWFFAADRAVLVATCAYGMGVDKANIRTVIHPEPAPTVEAFLQESGRAGRDGNPALSLTLAPPTPNGGFDARLRSPERSSDGADGETECRPDPEIERLREARGRAMRDYLYHSGCRRRFLLERMGASETECSGCDRCDGLNAEVIPALPAVRAAAHAHRRTIDRSALMRLLSGRPTAEDLRTRILHLRWLGVLRDRSGLECSEAVSAALDAGIIRVRRRPFWPGTIDIGRRLP